MNGPWPPLGFPGLHVDLGEHLKPWSPQWGVWLREPYAELRCAAGCEHHAHGADEVAHFLEHLDDLQHTPRKDSDDDSTPAPDTDPAGPGQPPGGP